MVLGRGLGKKKILRAFLRGGEQLPSAFLSVVPQLLGSTCLNASGSCSLLATIACTSCCLGRRLHDIVASLDFFLELLGDSSFMFPWGPTLRTWKAPVHLCVLRKPSGTVSGAFWWHTPRLPCGCTPHQLVLAQESLHDLFL